MTHIHQVYQMSFGLDISIETLTKYFILSYIITISLLLLVLQLWYLPVVERHFRACERTLSSKRCSILAWGPVGNHYMKNIKNITMYIYNNHKYSNSWVVCTIKFTSSKHMVSSLWAYNLFWTLINMGTSTYWESLWSYGKMTNCNLMVLFTEMRSFTVLRNDEMLLPHALHDFLHRALTGCQRCEIFFRQFVPTTSFHIFLHRFVFAKCAQ